MKKRRKTKMAELFLWGQGGTNRNMREESLKMAVKRKKRKKQLKMEGKMKTESNGVRGIRRRIDCHRIKIEKMKIKIEWKKQ